MLVLFICLMRLFLYHAASSRLPQPSLSERSVKLILSFSTLHPTLTCLKLTAPNLKDPISRGPLATFLKPSIFPGKVSRVSRASLAVPCFSVAERSTSLPSLSSSLLPLTSRLAPSRVPWLSVPFWVREQETETLFCYHVPLFSLIMLFFPSLPALYLAI